VSSESLEVQPSEQTAEPVQAEEVVGTDVSEVNEQSLVDALEANPDLESATIEVEPQAEEAPEPAKEIRYESIHDVDIDSLPKDIQAQVRPIVSIVAREVAEMRREKESFESARKEFVDLIDAMESSGYDVKPLQTRIDEQNKYIESMSENVISTAWQAFSATHPEFDGIPSNARDIFATELERLFEKHDGDTILDRMNSAYDYSLWRAGIDKNAITGKERDSIPSETKEMKQKVNPNAKKHAAIADGRIATSAPVRSVDELDWGEVLDRHAHLLER
jgi:hypothetical protein